MSVRPEVTRLVLFKHGIAYLERQGPSDGSFDLVFRRSEMNDVLKSLAVGVAGGGATVQSIGYEAPTDPDDDLERRNLLLEPDEALTGLLNAARGRKVEVTGFDGIVTRGEVLGVQAADAGDRGRRRLLTLRSADRTVSLVDLAQVGGIAFDDPQTADDLAYLVDRSRAATTGDNRVVTVSLSAPTDDVRVSYVVAAPVWRVSYRLVCDGNEISLVAMGIVRNPVDEDLTEVALTLTTGRPSSFDIDLYHDRLVRRAVVDEVRDSLEAPTEYRAGFAPGEPELGGAPTPYGAPAPAMLAGAAPRSFAARAMTSSMGEALAEAGDSGEYFEYRVGVPVSLKRGTAAMVPLLSARLDRARRERIWRAGPRPEPDMVVAFENTSGAVLEAGPAVIYDDENYAGEAMMPFTARGGQVLLPFGKDLAVTCRIESTTSMLVTRVRFGTAGLIEERRMETVHTLRAENSGDAEVDVIFELDRKPDATVIAGGDLLAPFEETATHRRFRLTVPAHGKADARTGDATVLSRDVQYDSLTGRDLHNWLDGRLLDDAAFAELSGVLEHRRRSWDLDGRAGQLVEEHSQNVAEQSRLTEQLSVLRDTGAEGAVRASTVAKLVALQERSAEVEQQQRSLRAQAEAERRAADTALADIVRRRG